MAGDVTMLIKILCIRYIKMNIFKIPFQYKYCPNIKFVQIL